MKYRKLSEDNDMMFGHGEADYYVDSAELVLQAILTRLRLLLGEWFLDTTDGTPWETAVLGKHSKEEYDYAIQERILNTYGVISLSSYSSRLNRETRSLTINFTASTMYGEITGSDNYVSYGLYR